MMTSGRALPNILVTGTPGVGKTSHCEALTDALPSLRHLAINRIVQERDCHLGRNEDFQSWIVDEDRLLDAIEDEVKQGGNVIDWHACDLFPESWIDLVVVLRTETSVLFDRLTSRGYGKKKLDENMDSEIMQVLLEEAREAYAEEVVVELSSNTAEDLEANVARIDAWVEQWKKKKNQRTTTTTSDAY
ncbi:MAG: factor activating pos9 [Phylliscum demangeonii]|nr:MAG: factor activating pos9 [Phylliscum demangeonii]